MILLLNRWLKRDKSCWKVAYTITIHKFHQAFNKKKYVYNLRHICDEKAYKRVSIASSIVLETTVIIVNLTDAISKVIYIDCGPASRSSLSEDYSTIWFCTFNWNSLAFKGAMSVLLRGFCIMFMHISSLMKAFHNNKGNICEEIWTWIYTNWIYFYFPTVLFMSEKGLSGAGENYVSHCLRNSA